jgi:dynein intermediate chain 1
VVKPPNQANLSKSELEEEIPRVLYARDPRKGTSLVRWAQKERAYKQVAMTEHAATHYAVDGWLVRCDSEEAKKQAEVERKEREAEQALDSEDPTDSLSELQHTDDSVASASLHADKSQQLLRNSFNFSERAVQAVPLPPRDKAVAAEPPKTVTASGSVTQWAIADAYRGKLSACSGAVTGSRALNGPSDSSGVPVGEEDGFGRHSAATSASADTDRGVDTTAALTTTNSATAANGDAFPGQTAAARIGGDGEEKQDANDKLHSSSMERGTRVLERMACLNAHRDITMHFKYWGDTADAQTDRERSLLPLWVFQPENAKKKHVTHMRWHPVHTDLFAAAYGSFDFMKQGSGLVLLHTLKNPAHPERSYKTTSGAMCLDFHQRVSSLLAVGLYDGAVEVLDARKKASSPLMVAQPKAGPTGSSGGGGSASSPGGAAGGAGSAGGSSSSGGGKHTDPVWGVRWQEDRELCFCSVSTDGRVATWRATGNGLACDDSLKLRHEQAGESGVDGENCVTSAQQELALRSLLGGTCFDFNPASEQVFIVGTEEGEVHECSRAYSSQLLRRFEGHSMQVYAVRWNPLHPRVFASASADWTVRIWDDSNSKPALKLDLGSPVADIQWMPSSASVLACATGDGKVVIFDLTTSRHEPMCEQRVVRRARLTSLAFNPTHPMLLAGDDKGGITALKLSPNNGWPSKSHGADYESLSRQLELARCNGGL